MADNATLNTNNAATGATNVVVAADEIGGALVQRVKPVFGDDGSGVDVSATNPLPVTFATQPVAFAAGATTTATQRTVAATDSPEVTALGTANGKLNGGLPAALATGGALKVTVQDTTGTPLDYTIPALVEGKEAAGTTVSAKPVTIGGLAKTANPTARTDGQAVNTLHDKLGKVIAVAALRDLKGTQQTTITSSTAETTIVTAVASTFLDVYGLVIANKSATATLVTIKDATAGTTRGLFYVPAADTRGFMLDAGSAWPQTTVNNNWTATCGTSVDSVYVTALYVKNT